MNFGAGDGIRTPDPDLGNDDEMRILMLTT
jgi:hypothetical protein